MCERKIGGSYNCRICGDIHTFGTPCKKEALPLQDIQISLEAVYDFFFNSPMVMETWNCLKRLIKELADTLGVPEEKIYNTESSGMEKKFEYNPLSDVLIKAESILARTKDIAIKNINVSRAQGEVMMDLLFSFEKKVLKKKEVEKEEAVKLTEKEYMKALDETEKANDAIGKHW